MRVLLTADLIEVRLALWQRVLGLMGTIRVPRADLREARVVADPMREVMGSGIKVGLRLPWLYYVARTLRLDEAFVVRRGLPGLSLEIGGEHRLRRVLLSTPEAEQLARALNGSAGGGPVSSSARPLPS